MTAVVLLTGRSMPRADTESPALVAALHRRGIDAELLPWDREPADGWSVLPLVVVRSTWDYTAQRDAFLDTMAAIDAVTRLVNPLAVLRWSSHKGYLVELGAAGVPVVPTQVVTGAVPDGLPDGELVVKPAVGAGGRGAVRTDRDGAAAAVRAVAGDAVVQPFLPAVLNEGEVSLVYLGGELSHAVRKRPAGGEFRVHAYLGGSLEPHRATAREQAVAEAALACAPGELSYARVDLVADANGPLVMELELVEPELFLTEGTVRVAAGGAAADRCAEVLARLL